MIHVIEAAVAGAVGGGVTLLFALRNNPRFAAWLGIKLPATK